MDRMRIRIDFMQLWFFYVLGTVYGLVAPLAAQTRAPQDPAVEPHHRLTFTNDRVRVFALDIPGGQDVYVRHQRNFLTVTLAGGRMVMWAEGTSPETVFAINTGDTRFFLGGPALGMRNAGKDDYKSIVVEFLDPQVTNYGFQYNRADGQNWDYGSSALAPAPDAASGFVHALSLRRATVRDVRLLAGEQLPASPIAVKQLVIAVTDLNLGSEPGFNFTKAGGEIVWLEARKSGLINRGAAAARFVVVELPQ